MLKIAYIDHSYHKKTRSTEFLLHILQTLGTVDIYWDESWETKIPMDFGPVDSINYDIIVFFQILYSPEILKQRKCRRILLVPMYDSVGDVSPSFWLPYRHYFFLNFSMALHNSVTECGIPSFYLQYFPDPNKFPVVNHLDYSRVFFWERNKDVTLNIVKNWFSECGDCSFHYHHAPDPGNESGLVGLANDGRWTESSWFATSAEYKEVLSSCSVFIAPRKREGIGMAFLEAMAMGLVVVGLPYPTLDEYISHGENGILVDERDRIDIKNVDWRSIGASARKRIEKGFLQYQAKIPELERWLVRLVSGNVSCSWKLVYYNLIRQFPKDALKRMRSLIHIIIKQLKIKSWGSR